MADAVSTNQQIIQRQREARAAAEGRKTLPERLKMVAATYPDARHVLEETITALAWYEDAIARARRDAFEEQRESQRDARAAYTQGRQDIEDEQRGGW